MFCQFIFINMEAGEAPCALLQAQGKESPPNPPKGGLKYLIHCIWLLRVKSGVFRPHLSAACTEIVEMPALNLLKWFG